MGDSVEQSVVNGIMATKKSTCSTALRREKKGSIRSFFFTPLHTVTSMDIDFLVDTS
jgi:uncharacterized protein YqhQ